MCVFASVSMCIAFSGTRWHYINSYIHECVCVCVCDRERGVCVCVRKKECVCACACVCVLAKLCKC